MKRITLLTLASLIFISAMSQKASVWRGPLGNGTYLSTGLLNEWPADGPEILWSYEELGKGHSTPVVYDGKIYVSAAVEPTGYIYVFNMNGKLLNKYEYGEEFFESYPGSRATPTLAGDMLYMFSGKGVLSCFKAESGELVWRIDVFKEYGGRQIRWGVNESPVVEDDKIYITPGGEKHFMLALNRKNGKLIWTSKGVGEQTAYCSPMLIDLPERKLIVTHSESHIIGIDRNNGEVLWSFDQPNQYSVHPNTPLYHDGKIFYCSGYGKGGGMLELNSDGSSVTQKWYSDRFDSRMGGAVYYDGYIYTSGDRNKYWYCIDWETGEEKYAEKALTIGVIIMADGKLFCYGQRGELVMAEATPAGFIKKGQVKVTLGSEQHWAHPMIHDGILYLRHGSALIAYKIK